MPHLQSNIVESRSWQLVERLRRTVLHPHDSVPLRAEFAHTKTPVPWAERQRLAYRPVSQGEKWGETWDSAWFRVEAEVPAAWAGSQVVARIDLAGEVLVFEPSGEPLVGLCSGSAFHGDYSKDLVWLTPRARGGERVELWLEAAANDLFGVTKTDPEYPHVFEHLHGVHRGVVKTLQLCRLDTEGYALLIDLEVLHDLYKALPDGSPRKAKLLRGLDRAVGAYHRAGAAAARGELAPLLAVPADPAAIRFTGVGHAHIDTAWLWPMRETIRKTARTFASQLGLIERYPGFVFGASQAQLYAFIKQHYPSLYARVKSAVAAGRWEVQGAMWVEADCNLPCGESLVRQVLHGKRFFRSEFGVDVRNLWLPDVFGYSGQLPQILGKAGVPFFLTQKLSWNKVNEFPHNTFVWRGIDGSEVLAHFPPENDYNSRCRPGALIKAQERHKERGIIDEAISLFGIGDGGGGPKEEFIERALRLRDLNGCPPYRFGAAQPVLDRMARHRAEFDTWVGELYFEMHRATYTTQAAMKRANRRAEEALLAAELLCSAAPDGYPAAELDRAWKTVLTNQFHDIIPGSSIHWVYEEAVPQDEAVAAEARCLGAAAAARSMRADPEACTIFNPSGTAFDDAVCLPEGWQSADVDGRPVPCQPAGRQVWARVAVPAQRAAVLRRAARAAAPAQAAAKGDYVLANDVVRYAFGADGRLVSAVAVSDGRELMAGPGNDLVMYEDRPHCFDAWDIDEQYALAPLHRLSVESIERADGAVWAELLLRGRIGSSRVTQHIRLRAGSARLDFVTHVDWRERHKLLRVAFPTTLQAEQFACEVQYGHVLRPTHRNTTWDSARFEVCGHRWADLSELTRGVALLNDSKYGYACRGGTLSLSLLRASTEPDPVADVGEHRFTYALLPHDGGHAASPVRAEAAMLNAGVVALPGLDGTGFVLPVRVEGEGLELAVLKAAEDAGGGLIARVVEVRGARARGRVVAEGRRIVPTDTMEWHDRRDAAAQGALALDMGPFAIETFRIA